MKFLKNYWFVLLLLFAGLHLTCFQLYGYDFKKLVGDLGDSRFIISIVEFNYQWAIGNYNDYWDGFFMFPDSEVISYSDNLLGITPLYSVFRLSGFSVLTSFQLLMIACHSLNYLICFYCFYKISGNKYAAACGAFVFAFSILLNGIHNHPQYAFRFCIPLFIYFLFNYLNTFNLKTLFYAVIALIVQFYLGAYLGVFLLIAALFFSFCFLLVYRFHFTQFRKLFIHGLTTAPLFILALVPMLYYYYKRIKITGYYSDYDFYMETIPRFSSYFKSFPGSVLWPFLTGTNAHSEFSWLHFLFPGGVVILSLCLAVYFVIKKQKLYLIVLSTIFFILLFTINYEGHTLYGYLMKIPGVKSARVVARLVTVLIFFAGWLVCLNINFVLTKFHGHTKAIALCIGLVLVLDNYCLPAGFKTFKKDESTARIDALKDKILKTPDFRAYKAFAYVPGIKENSQDYHIDAMLCALELHCKTVNGYSSSCHKAYGPFWKNIDSTSLSGWCKAMNLPIQQVLIVK